MVNISEGDDATIVFTGSGDRVHVTAEIEPDSGLLNWYDSDGNSYGLASMNPTARALVFHGWI